MSAVRLKSMVSGLFAQPFVQTQIKENIRAPRHWNLWGKQPVTGGFPSQMTSNAFDDVIIRGLYWDSDTRNIASFQWIEAQNGHYFTRDRFKCHFREKSGVLETILHLLRICYTIFYIEWEMSHISTHYIVIYIPHTHIVSTKSVVIAFERIPFIKSIKW